MCNVLCGDVLYVDVWCCLVLCALCGGVCHCVVVCCVDIECVV